MPHSLTDRFKKNLFHCIGPSFCEKKYLLGVSGGRDSICLLDLFIKVIPVSQLGVVHVNYQLRGKDSDKDEKLVRKICEAKSISFYGLRPQVKKSSEASLRNIRRRFLKAIKTENHFDYIALGHHAQDQLETVLMRIVRGTGVFGLEGMKAKNGSLLRPLLPFTAGEISNYVATHQLKFRIDHSNFSEQYFRNQIRLELIPVLEKLSHRYGGTEAFYRRIHSLFSEVGDLKTLQERQIRRVYNELSFSTPFWIRINLEKFKKLSLLNKRQFIHLICRDLKIESGRKEIDFILEKILAQKNMDGVGGLKISISCGEIFFQGKNHRVRQGKILHPLQLEIPLPKVPEGYELRFARAGDRFRSGKLKKKLLQVRIPQLERRLLPVLAQCDSSQVVWFVENLTSSLKKS